MDPTLAITRALGAASALAAAQGLDQVGEEAKEALQRISGGVFGEEAAVQAEASLFIEYLQQERPPPRLLEYWAAILDDAAKDDWEGPRLSKQSAPLVFDWILKF